MKKAEWPAWQNGSWRRQPWRWGKPALDLSTSMQDYWHSSIPKQTDGCSDPDFSEGRIGIGYKFMLFSCNIFLTKVFNTIKISDIHQLFEFFLSFIGENNVNLFFKRVWFWVFAPWATYRFAFTVSVSLGKPQKKFSYSLVARPLRP